MYASGRTESPAVGPPYHIPCRKRLPTGDRSQKEDYGSKRGRNAFLKQPIPTIGVQSVTRSREIENYNYITRKNYEYLLKCVNRYASLTGKKLKHRPGNDIGESIAKLYNDLKKILPEDVEINFDISGDKLIFVLWDYYPWGEYSLYWVSVAFVEKLPTPLRRLAISFLHQFRDSMRFDTTNHHEDLDFMFEWRYECVDPDDKEEHKEILELINSYHEGKIHKLMDRISRQNYHKNLPKALDEYVPASAYEKELLALMKEGLQFIGEKIPTIFQYAYDQYDDEDNDDYPVRLDQRFLLIYEHDDIMEGYLQYLNETAGNAYEIRPCITLILNPDMTETFTPDDFPAEFFKYMDKLMNFLIE